MRQSNTEIHLLLIGDLHSTGIPGLPPFFVQVTEPDSQVNPVHTVLPGFPQIAWQSSAHESTAVGLQEVQMILEMQISFLIIVIRLEWIAFS